MIIHCYLEWPIVTESSFWRCFNGLWNKGACIWFMLPQCSSFQTRVSSL